MSDAYLCDRCREFHEGEATTGTAGRIIWDELSHHPPAVVMLADLIFTVEAFIHSVYNIDADKAWGFCNDCLLDMMILFVRQRRPQMQVLYPHPESKHQAMIEHAVLCNGKCEKCEDGY